ncbi:hypothetical protein SEVIR_1G126900v4 [Setaria viridis]|nr:uncharacterized protein LOC117865356 [Setaria viridis]
MRRHGSGACPREEARGLRGHDLDRQVGKKVMLRANHLLVSIDDNLFQTSSTVTCNMKALENLESHPLDMGPAKVRSTEAQRQAVLRWDDVFGIGIIQAACHEALCFKVSSYLKIIGSSHLASEFD